MTLVGAAEPSTARTSAAALRVVLTGRDRNLWLRTSAMIARAAVRQLVRSSPSPIGLASLRDGCRSIAAACSVSISRQGRPRNRASAGAGDGAGGA